ncbi:butyrophilin subfamily 2 member A1-like [Chrysemys picta bellii]|uniref:butyrophilin subfamily 2 member A1-like n=1 Tax=Chrysemys picta bellii TaxID=8478 RepID=UPI0032B2CE12
MPGRGRAYVWAEQKRLLKISDERRRGVNTQRVEQHTSRSTAVTAQDDLQSNLEKEREILRSELENERGKSLAELGWSKVRKNAVNVILDPDTAHPSLMVSENGRSVKWRGLQQDVTDNPKRFDSETCMLGLEGFTSGRHYWEHSSAKRLCQDQGPVALGSLQRKSTDRSLPTERSV